MTKKIDIDRILSHPELKRLRGAALSGLRFLTLSLADEPVAPAACLSVSIEKGGVSLVYAKRFLTSYSVLHMKNFKFRDGIYPDANEVASSAKTFMTEKRLGIAPVALSIPKSWTIIKASEFPVSVGDDLSDSIQYEMDRLTPLSSDEVFFDYRSFGTTGGMVQFTLSVTKTDTVKDYLDALKENGFIVKRLTSAPSALGALQDFSDKKKNRAKLLLEIAEDHVETSTVIDGRLRSVVTSVLDDQEAKSDLDKLINSNIERLKKDGLSPLVVIYFRDPDPRMKEALRSKFPAIRFSEEMGLGLKGIADKKDIYLHALGGAIEALWPEADALNLLTQGKKEVQKKSYVLTAVIAAVFMVLLAVYWMVPLWQERELASSMDKKISEIKKDAMSVEKLKQEMSSLEDKISLIKDFHRGETRRIVLVRELSKIVPEDTWINRIRIADDNVELYGYSEAATKLIPKIDASKYFMNVEFASPTMRDSRMDMDRFAIKAKVGEK